MPLFNQVLPLPTSYVEDMGVQYVSSSSLKIAPGICRDTTNSKDIALLADTTLSIASSGAAGLLDTGSKSNSTWYAAHAIGDSSGVNPDSGILSLSATAPTLPSGYDVFRRLGWGRIDGSGNFFQFNLLIASGQYRLISYTEHEEGDCEVLTAGASTSFSAVSLATLIPSTSRNGILSVSTDGDVDFEGVYLRYTGLSTVAPVHRVISGGAGGRNRCSSEINMRISSSQSVDYKNSASGNATYIWVKGYVDVL